MSSILDEIENRNRSTAQKTPTLPGYSCNCKKPCSEPATEPEYYTPVEMAALLRIPVRTLEKWTLQRRIPVCKVGRLNRFPRIEIQKRLLSGNLLK